MKRFIVFLISVSIIMTGITVVAHTENLSMLSFDGNALKTGVDELFTYNSSFAPIKVTVNAVELTEEEYSLKSGKLLIDGDVFNKAETYSITITDANNSELGTSVEIEQRFQKYYIPTTDGKNIISENVEVQPDMSNATTVYSNFSLGVRKFTPANTQVAVIYDYYNVSYFKYYISEHGNYDVYYNHGVTSGQYFCDNKIVLSSANGERSKVFTKEELADTAWAMVASNAEFTGKTDGSEYCKISRGSEKAASYAVGAVFLEEHIDTAAINEAFYGTNLIPSVNNTNKCGVSELLAFDSSKFDAQSVYINDKSITSGYKLANGKLLIDGSNFNLDGLYNITVYDSFGDKMSCIIDINKLSTIIVNPVIQKNDILTEYVETDTPFLLSVNNFTEYKTKVLYITDNNAENSHYWKWYGFEKGSYKIDYCKVEHNQMNSCLAEVVDSTDTSVTHILNDGSTERVHLENDKIFRFNGTKDGSEYVKISSDFSEPLGGLKRLGVGVLVLNEVPDSRSVDDEFGSAERSLYVSCDGNDTNDGSIAHPLATMSAAKQKVRELKASKTGDITVYFRNGIYKITGTMAEFTSDDSGTEEGSITYTSYPGEKAVFEGSTELDTDFFEPITDETIINRIPKTAQGRVLKYDLTKSGIDYIQDYIPYGSKLRASVSNLSELDGEDARLYVNGKAQTISQWPNGEGRFSEFYSYDDGKNGTFGAIGYYDDEPNRWETANDAYVGGFFGADYRFERIAIDRIDNKEKAIYLGRNTDFGIITNTSKRWKAFNLLEELDTPGEYYIDKENLILYYYPIDKMNNIELSHNRNYIIKMKKADYILFKNLEFNKFDGTVFYGTISCDNISITDCDFENIGVHAIKTYAMFDKFLISCGAGQNWKISNNIFHEIGEGAINLNGFGGNEDKYNGIKSGLVVTNNYCNSCGYTAYSTGFLSVEANQGEISNNLVSNLPFHAVGFSGPANRFSFNEINAINKHTVDVGAFYSGRNSVRRDNEISYNFLHGGNAVYRPLSDRGLNNALIYWDDSLAGQTAHHNILSDCQMALKMGGSSNSFYDNTIINSAIGMSLYIKTNDEAIKERYTSVLEDEYLSDVMSSISPTWDREAASESLGSTHYMNVSDNLLVGSGTPDIPTGFVELENTYSNNINVSEADFVDSDKLDYRLKSDSSLLSENPDLLSEGFDIDSIGINWKKFDKTRITEKRSFELTYPISDDILKNNSIEFGWERAFDADSYIFEIATDEDFSNIIISENVPENHFEAELSNGTYYWRVKAKNTTRQLMGQWLSNSCYKLTVNKTESIYGYSPEIIEYSTASDNYHEFYNGIERPTYFVSATTFSGIEGPSGRIPRAYPNLTPENCTRTTCKWYINLTGKYAVSVASSAQNSYKTLGPFKASVVAGGENLVSEAYECRSKADWNWINDGKPIEFTGKDDNSEYIELFAAQDTWLDTAEAGDEKRHMSFDAIRLIPIPDETELTNIKFYDSNNSEIKDIRQNAGNTVTVKGEIVKSTGLEALELFCAVYNGSELLSVGKCSLENKSGNEVFCFDTVLPENITDFTVKAFCWSNQMPQMEYKYVYKLN